MPELLTSKEQQIAERGHPAVIGKNQSIPTSGYNYVELKEIEHESILHPVKAVTDIISAINENTAVLRLLLQKMTKETTFVDRQVGVGATVGYSVEYHERRFVYVYAFNNVILSYSTGGNITVAAGTWTNLSPVRGTVITISGGSDSAPQPLVFRACDFAF
jgi:hypothetical protein